MQAVFEWVDNIPVLWAFALFIYAGGFVILLVYGNKSPWQRLGDAWRRGDVFSHVWTTIAATLLASFSWPILCLAVMLDAVIFRKRRRAHRKQGIQELQDLSLRLVESMRRDMLDEVSSYRPDRNASSN